MAVPSSTLWPRGSHTEGKHLVLQNYLQAWFPILGMGNRNGRILFIDGFAGPGEYEGGEEGSPVVAMRALAKHSARSSIEAEVVFLFIEQDPKRAAHLEDLVDRWGRKLPRTAEVHVLQGSFESLMDELLDHLDEQEERMAPALVMMDPFGVKGIPIRIIQRILGNPKCEVYVTFMWEPINMRMTTPEFEGHMTDMFGTPDWKEAIGLSGEERKTFLHELYRRQLKANGAKQVVHFHLLKGAQLKYSIFFGTGHTKGSDRMKQAIWKADPTGDYRFRGGEQTQMSFLGPDFVSLQEALREQFGEAGWVSIEEISEFVESDATSYHTGQLKSKALKPMEQAGQIEVDESTRRRRLSYPEGCRISFRPQRLF